MNSTTLSNPTYDADLLARNKDLADKLALIASYYKMSRDSYRAKSFYNASVAVGQYQNHIISGAQARANIKGIGDSIENVIEEYLTSGIIQRLEELQNKFKDQTKIINWLLSFYGIGPVTAIDLYNRGIRTLEDLWFNGNLNEAQKIGVIWKEHIDMRIPREEMILIDASLSSFLDKYDIKWDIAGSFRREEPSSGDIDVLVQSRDDLNMDNLIHILSPILPATLAKGQKFYRGIVRIDLKHNGHRIDIRLIDPASYTYALMYFTGSQNFNILMRQRAIQLGLTLNEYGLFDQQSISFPATTEQDIFDHLDVKYISPIERTKTISSLIHK